MKLKKRLTALMLSAALAVIPALPASANELPPIGELRYASVYGEVKRIDPYTTDGVNIDDSRSFVVIETPEGNEVNLHVTADTYLHTKEGAIAPGMSIAGFYNGSLPVILIYPPQYQAEAIVDLSEGQSIKYSDFDENHLSRDGELKLNISDDTEILWHDGTVFEGPITGKRALVFYTVTTRSIPPQTAPESIIIFPDTPAPESGEIPDSSASATEGVESQLTDSDIYFRLRAIFEVKGAEDLLEWDGASQRVLIGDRVSFQIGSPMVSVNGITVMLSAPPELINGSTYVPMDFFTTVLLSAFPEIYQ